MNLVLIGMSGAGKTYLGKILAERLGLTYLDLDEAMEEKAGKPLPDILDALGEELFIAFEGKSAIEATEGVERHLISTGGSIIYDPSAMEHLRNISQVVYLDVPYEAIEARVSGSADRLGRIVGMGEKSLRELYDSRVPLYQQYAHYTIEPEQLGLEGTVAAIESLLRGAGREYV